MALPATTISGEIEPPKTRRDSPETQQAADTDKDPTDDEATDITSDEPIYYSNPKTHRTDKGTDLNISPITLGMIEDDLNFMPRKLHDWLPAQTVYDKLKDQLICIYC